jgi:protein associated with RNAse G/E
MGIIWSDDSLIYGDKFYVFDGNCHFLILNEKEKEWLKTVWDKYSKVKNKYLDLNVDIKSDYGITYLTNNYCPICLKKRQEFENHHCVPVNEGGIDLGNMLKRLLNSMRRLEI